MNEITQRKKNNWRYKPQRNFYNMLPPAGICIKLQIYSSKRVEKIFRLKCLKIVNHVQGETVWASSNEKAHTNYHRLGSHTSSKS